MLESVVSIRYVDSRGACQADLIAAQKSETAMTSRHATSDRRGEDEGEQVGDRNQMGHMTCS